MTHDHHSKHQIPASVESIKALAEKMFESTRASHDWEHTLRVYRLCEKIGKAEGADMEALLIAACLHDIGRCYQDASNGQVCHAEKGQAIASRMLRSFAIPEEKKKNILHCIRSHRFRGNRRPETQEAMILFDADKLDAIGAVGVARAFLFAGEVGAMLHNSHTDIESTKAYTKEDTGFREFRVKLLRIKDRMLTKEGKRMAAERHDFMVSFFDRFLLEHAGVK
jgi:uncharacterized protein